MAIDLTKALSLPHLLSHHAALVHQKELIFGFMTPREHLLFQARARMSREFSYDDILKRVTEVSETCLEG